MSLQEQANPKQTAWPQKRRANNWPKGVSGNPAGARAAMERDANLRQAIAARGELIYAEALDDLGDNLTDLERTLLKQACVNVSIAERALNVDLRSRLLGSATRIFKQLRQAVDRRAAQAPMPSLRELLKRK